MAIFKSSDGALFLQKDGPNTPVQFIGCVDADTLTEPGGAIDALIRCFKGDGLGWDINTSTVTTTDPVTTTITTFVEGLQSALELVKNDVATLYIHQRSGGRANLFLNYARSWVLAGIRVGEKTAMDIVHHDTEVPSTAGYAISAKPPVYRLGQTTILKKTVGSAIMTGIVFCDSRCITGFISCKALGGASADVFATVDSGATWAATTADPFAIGEDIAAIACFNTLSRTTRIMVALGTTRGAPMAIAYSDDSGTTWTAIDVGTVNGQFAPSHNSLFAYDADNVWVVCGAGYIYKSRDGGVTWTAQESGIATVNPLYAVHFITSRVGAAVGANGAVLTTNDSGVSWTLKTPPAATTLNTVWVVDSDHLWCGGLDGILYYSVDGGATWATRGFAGAGIGDIRAIKFYDTLFGFMAVNFTAGIVYKTIDGGYIWELQGTPPTGNLNGMAVCGQNSLFAVGV